MVGQTTTIIYLQNFRNKLDKQIREAEIGTDEIPYLVEQDIKIKDALEVVTGSKVDTKDNSKDKLIQELRQVIDGLMDENKKYREMYWEYRDSVDRGH